MLFDGDKKLSRRQLLKSGAAGALASALGGSLFVGGCRSGSWPRPNVLFLLIDTLRADRLGAYGNRRGLSPTLDAVASEATVFERAIAQAPWTQPSVASLFCSRYASVHKVTDYGSAVGAVHKGAGEVKVLSDSFVTLAELFRQAGYETAAFVANLFVLEEFGFAQGFEHFDASFANNTTNGDVVNAAALEWLDKRDRSRPVFCFLHYMDVHGPYNAGPQFLDPLLDEVEAAGALTPLTQMEFERLDYLRTLPPEHTNLERHERLRVFREYWAARYDAGVRQMDYYLGQLRDATKEMGLWDDALVVLTSDHGESLAEHGYWDHGHTLYDPELHVPLMMRRPHKAAAGRMSQMVSLVDVMPTLAEMLGLGEVEGAQGRSLASLIEGGTGESRAAFAEATKSGPEQRCVYLGDYKYVMKKGDPLPRLYDLEDDPGEMNDISQGDAQKAKQLGQVLQQQLQMNAELAAKVEVETVALTAEQQKRLRSLGYLK